MLVTVSLAVVVVAVVSGPVGTVLATESRRALETESIKLVRSYNKTCSLYHNCSQDLRIEMVVGTGGWLVGGAIFASVDTVMVAIMWKSFYSEGYQKQLTLIRKHHQSTALF